MLLHLHSSDGLVARMSDLCARGPEFDSRQWFHWSVCTGRRHAELILAPMAVNTETSGNGMRHTNLLATQLKYAWFPVDSCIKGCYYIIVSFHGTLVIYFHVGGKVC